MHDSHEFLDAPLCTETAIQGRKKLGFHAPFISTRNAHPYPPPSHTRVHCHLAPVSTSLIDCCDNPDYEELKKIPDLLCLVCNYIDDEALPIIQDRIEEEEAEEALLAAVV